MQAPVPLSSITAAVRKAVTALRTRFSGRPAAEAAERQHAESPGQRRAEQADPQAVSQSGHVTNQMSGTAHKVFQAGDIHGDVRF